MQPNEQTYTEPAEQLDAIPETITGITFQIQEHDGGIFLVFSQPIPALGLTPDLAHAIGDELRRRAKRLKQWRAYENRKVQQPEPTSNNEQ